LAVAALATLASSAPSHQKDNQAPIPDYIQYWLPIAPTDQFLFAIGANNAGIKAADITKCPVNYLKLCQKDLAAALNSDVTIFDDPEKFAALIYGLYKVQIAKSLLNLCGAQIAFRTCLGVFYPACTDALTIFRDQLKDIGKAFTLAGVYDDIEFDCGGGLTQGTVNWQCIVKVNNNDQYSTQMTPCWDAYRQSIDSDPDKFCEAGQTLSLCVTGVYRNLDSCVNNEVAWWACERANRRTKLEGYCHKNTCDSIFPKPPTKAPTSDAESFWDFVNAGGLHSEAKHRYFKNLHKYGRHQAAEQ